MKKFTNKIVLIVLATMMIFSLAACGGTKNKLLGTWEGDQILIDGSYYTIEEALAIDESIDSLGLSNLMLVFKDGGSVYVRSGENSDIGKWAINPDGTITIGNIDNAFIDDDGYLSMEFYRSNLLFKKTSDSQTIPTN